VGFWAQTETSWTAVSGIVLFVSTWVIGNRFLKNWRIFVFLQRKRGISYRDDPLFDKNQETKPPPQPSLSPPKTDFQVLGLPRARVRPARKSFSAFSRWYCAPSRGPSAVRPPVVCDSSTGNFCLRSGNCPNSNLNPKLHPQTL